MSQAGPENSTSSRSDEKTIFFGHPPRSENPVDGLANAAAVLSFLSSALCNGLEFSNLDQSDARPGEGLGIILRSVERAIDIASARFSQKLDDLEEETLLKVGLPEGARDKKELRSCWRDGFARGAAWAKTEGDTEYNPTKASRETDTASAWSKASA